MRRMAVRRMVVCWIAVRRIAVRRDSRLFAMFRSAIRAELRAELGPEILSNGSGPKNDAERSQKSNGCFKRVRAIWFFCLAAGRKIITVCAPVMRHSAASELRSITDESVTLRSSDSLVLSIPASVDTLATGNVADRLH